MIEYLYDSDEVEKFLLQTKEKDGKVKYKVFSNISDIVKRYESFRMFYIRKKRQNQGFNRSIQILWQPRFKE